MKKGQLFSLIGPGRVGTSLAMALEKKKWVCKHVVCEGKSLTKPVRLKSIFRNAIIGNAGSISDDFKILLITVQDDEIQNVVTEIAKLNHIHWDSKVVYHTSGARRVGLLSPLEKLGASIGALHPIAAFVKEYQLGSACGIFYDFYGNNRALFFARQITRMLNSKLVVLKNERERILLHIASAIASNSTVIAVRKAEKLIADFVGSTGAKILMASLLTSTVKNLSENSGMKALSGPLVRGDVDVISQHLEALESDKTLLQFYKSWSLLGVQSLLTSREGRQDRLKAITKLLEEK